MKTYCNIVSTPSELTSAPVSMEDYSIFNIETVHYTEGIAWDSYFCIIGSIKNDSPEYDTSLNGIPIPIQLVDLQTIRKLIIADDKLFEVFPEQYQGWDYNFRQFEDDIIELIDRKIEDTNNWYYIGNTEVG